MIMKTPPIEWIPACASTNDRAALADADIVVAADLQTAGRGQRGNSWEAEPGQNLTFSIRLGLDLTPDRLFDFSIAVALGVADTVARELADAGVNESVTVKWPNDVYVGTNKIAGILIENRLSGAHLDYVVAGVGVNVNQLTFLSDAPNPVSLAQLTDREYDLRALLELMISDIMKRVEACQPLADAVEARKEYFRRLYLADRREHTFYLADGTPIKASIVAVEPSGHITLSNGQSYAFKEIAYHILGRRI